MADNIQVRKARLKDAEAIAAFVNRAHPSAALTRMEVAERFSQVGFMLAEADGQVVGLVGFQVENLVIRVTDFLIGPGVDRVATGQALVAAMEEAGSVLQAEAAILFLPPDPSSDLIDYWRVLGYERLSTADMLHRAWREAAAEWNAQQSEAVVKQLRDEVARKPF
ncbi:MAG TPA: hypothetical protein PKH77_14105 [Anaerolineae bacterium]|nr:hypothetical protein [Anaerolineae bacterium]